MNKHSENHDAVKEKTDWKGIASLVFLLAVLLFAVFVIGFRQAAQSCEARHPSEDQRTAAHWKEVEARVVALELADAELARRNKLVMDWEAEDDHQAQARIDALSQAQANDHWQLETLEERAAR